MVTDEQIKKANDTAKIAFEATYVQVKRHLMFINSKPNSRNQTVAKLRC